MIRPVTRLLGRVLVVLAVLAVSGIVQPMNVLAADIGLPLFGAYMYGTDSTQLARALNLGAGTVTIQFSWETFEPTQTGTLNASYTATIDTMVQNAVSRGLTPVAVVGAGPPWAAVNTYGALRHDKKAAFQTFVRNLVAHYNTRGLHHWMIWPEPDAVQNPVNSSDTSRGAWGDEPEWYAEVMMAAKSELTAVDPNAKLILGPLAHDRFYAARSTSWCVGADPSRWPYNCGADGLFAYDFLDRVLAVPGAAGAFDAVSVNAYRYYGPAWENGANGYDVAAKIFHVRGRLASKGLDLPIVIGESGVVSGVFSGSPGWLPFMLNGVLLNFGAPTEERQAAYVGQLYTRAKAAGAAAVIWYTMDESDPVSKYGLYNTDHTAKSGVPVYQEMSRRLSNAALHPFAAVGVVTPRTGAVERYGFIDDNNNITVVAWGIPSSADANYNANPPQAQAFVPNGYQGFDRNGNAISPASTVDGGTIWNLDENPVFFRGRAYRIILPSSPSRFGRP
jgi:hypothetical protein